MSLFVRYTEPAPLILVRLRTVDGTGSGLDADKVRGRELPSDRPVFYWAPAFTPPPSFADAVSQTLFGA